MRVTVHPAAFLSACMAFCALWLWLAPVQEIPAAPGIRRNVQAARSSIELDAAILERYVGHYEGRADFTVDVSIKDGRLYAQSPGVSVPFEMLATSERDFFLKNSPDVDVKFRVDRTGTATGFDATTPYGPLSLDRAR